MGRPHPVLRLFHKWIGRENYLCWESWASGRGWENGYSLPTLSSACLLPQKLHIFRVRQILEAASLGKLSKWDQRSWRRRCSSDQRPKSSLLLQALTFLLPPGMLLKTIAFSKPHFVHCAWVFWDFEISTLVLQCLSSLKLKWGSESNLEDALRVRKNKDCEELRNDCSENQ